MEIIVYYKRYHFLTNPIFLSKEENKVLLCVVYILQE